MTTTTINSSSTDDDAVEPRTTPTLRPDKRGSRITSTLRTLVLALGALLFLFPFYYMIIGSFQAKPDTSLAGVIPHTALTLHNYRQIDARVDLVRSLVNSGIFTAGVILGTIVFGLLAGYALARLHFRGR